MIAMTKKTFRLMTAAAGIALLSGAALAQADDKMGSNRASQGTAAMTPQAVGVEQTKLAADLVAYGRQAVDPIALLLAGQIEADIGGTETKREKTSEAAGDGAGAAAGTKTERARTTAASLFTEARTLARGDSELLARIERVANRKSKGRVEGPTVHRDSVRARTNDWYEVNFRGGEPARVVVIGDGDTDLDLYIYDQNGNQICTDTDYTDRLICSWNPAWTGPFRVKISNLGGVYNNYHLSTN